MNNRTLDEPALLELYILAAMKLLDSPLAEGERRIIDAVDLWREVAANFPPDLPHEDIDVCTERGPAFFVSVVMLAGERLNKRILTENEE